MGVEYTLNETWALKGVLTYYLYDDLAPYLFTDTTGNSVGFYLAVIYRY